MSPNPADTIGRTLARLASLGSRGRSRRSPDNRLLIQRCLDSAEEPLGVEDLCERTGLHPNTIRRHLELMQANGEVERLPGPRIGRGRPPWLYRTQASGTTAYQRLADELSRELRSAEDPGLPDAVARRWRDTAHPPAPADTPRDAVRQAIQTLRRLGFTATESATGAELLLTECPYAELVRERQVICDIHLAALVQCLEDTGQPVTVESLDVFLRPEVCVAHLRRPDVSPARTLTPSPTEKD